MSAFLITMFAVSVIAVCVGPCYCCKRLRKVIDKSGSIDSESPLVHIKISHPQRDGSANEIATDESDTRRNSIDSSGAKEMKQVAREVGPVPSEEARIVSMELPRNRRRVSTRIWSAELRNQLENITNSSSEICGETKLVRAQIEANSARFASNVPPFRSRRGDYSDSSTAASIQGNLNDEKDRKLSSAVVKKWKNLKRRFICTRSEQSTLFKEVSNVEGQSLNIPVQTVNQCSSFEYSTRLQKNRFVDVSTSTRLSTNGSNANGSRTNNDKVTAKLDDKTDKSDKILRQSQNDDQSNSRLDSEALQEVTSLIERPSANGRSTCDLRISGLSMSQAQLLDLFEATEGKNRSASIVSTKEALVISIKFHRRRNSNESSRTKDTSYYECPLTKLYRSLPEMMEDLSISKLFRSQISDRSSRTPSVQMSDCSKTLNSSRNETSYIAFPRPSSRYVGNESMFGNRGSLSRRFSNSHTTRFFEERQI